MADHLYDCDEIRSNRSSRSLRLLLAGALGLYQLKWRDIKTRKVQSKLKRDHLAINRHTARFIIVGRYTAKRPGATLGLHCAGIGAGDQNGTPAVTAKIDRHIEQQCVVAPGGRHIAQRRNGGASCRG